MCVRTQGGEGANGPRKARPVDKLRNVPTRAWQPPWKALARAADRARRKEDGCAGLRAPRLLSYELELVRHMAELRKRTDVHLPHRPAAVDLHRGLGDA